MSDKPESIDNDEEWIDLPDSTILITESVNYSRNAAYERGSFINDIILLERYMDEYICRYFAKDEEHKEELLNWVFGHLRITFKNKLDIFREVVDKNSKDFVKENPTFYGDINKLLEQRNIYAHYLLDTTDEGFRSAIEDGNLVFLKFHKTTSKVIFSEELVSQYKEELHRYIRLVGNLLV